MHKMFVIFSHNLCLLRLCRWLRHFVLDFSPSRVFLRVFLYFANLQVSTFLAVYFDVYFDNFRLKKFSTSHVAVFIMKEKRKRRKDGKSCVGTLYKTILTQVSVFSCDLVPEFFLPLITPTHVHYNYLPLSLSFLSFFG